MEIIFKSAYSEKERPVTENNEPTMTKQALAEELDVNNIIRKYNKTGIMQKAHDFEGVYGEFDSFDLREAIEKVKLANELFLEVPSSIRSEFNNDAGAFVDFATNPVNIEQMREWKLAPPEQSEPPQPPPEPPPEPPPPQQ